MAFARPPNRPFEGRDLGFIEQLTPHLARAFQIGLRVGTFAVQERAIDQVVNRLPVGIILLDGTGRVLHLNAAAEAIVGTGDEITIARGAILAARSDKSARLRGLISSAVAARTGPRAGIGGRDGRFKANSCQALFGAGGPPAGCSQPDEFPETRRCGGLRDKSRANALPAGAGAGTALRPQSPASGTGSSSGRG